MNAKISLNELIELGMSAPNVEALSYVSHTLWKKIAEACSANFVDNTGSNVALEFNSGANLMYTDILGIFTAYHEQYYDSVAETEKLIVQKLESLIVRVA